MAGGKKYNIWIAYSDLFTNLSAFIFISALGAFAAIGSGTRVSPGLGAFETCSIPNAVRAELEKDGSQLRRVGEGLRPTGSREGCTEYYAVERSRYAPGEGGILDHTGRARRRQAINAGICEPVWTTANLASFARSDSQIVFLGVAEENNDRSYPTACRNHRPNGERPPAHFPRERAPIQVIFDCLLTTGSGYEFCPRIRQCVRDEDAPRNSWCRQVRDIYQRGVYAGAACQREQAEARAKYLYDLCDNAMGPDFPDHEFDRPDMMPGANQPDQRRRLWGRGVDFDSVTRDRMNQGLPESHPLRHQPRDSILLELRYGP